MANRAAFTLDGTPSEHPTTGRGFNAVAGQVIACQLEDLPALDALSVTFEVQNNAAPEANGPLASKDALQATFTGGVAKKLLASPGDITSLTIPASTTLSTWVVRCTVVTAEGVEYFDRAVAVRRGSVRAFVPYEETEYDPRGYGDSLTELAREGVAFVWKDESRAGTTANLVATRSGDVLTADANGVLPAQGGVTLIVGDRLLVKDQTLKQDNGIYDVTDVGSGGTPYVLTRSSDANENSEFSTDMRTPVLEGTEAGVWVLGTSGAIVVNTTELTFYRDQSLVAGTAVGQVPYWTGSAWLPTSDVMLPTGADRTVSALAPATGSGTAGYAVKFAGAAGAAAGGASPGGAGGPGRFWGGAGGAGTGALAAGAGGHAYLIGGAAGADGGGGGAAGGNAVVDAAAGTGAGLAGIVQIGVTTAREVNSGSGTTLWSHAGRIAATVALAVGAAPAGAGAVRLSHGAVVNGNTNTPGTDRVVLSWGAVANDTTNLGDANVVTRVTGSRVDAYCGGTQVAQLGAAASDFLKLGAIPASAGTLRFSHSGFAIKLRNIVNTADLNIVTIDAGTGSIMTFGDSTLYVNLNAGGGVYVNAGALVLRTTAGAQTATFNCNNGQFNWDATTFSPILSQTPHATTPHTFTIQAQNVTTGTGSDLNLQSGTGSVAPGAVTLYAGATQMASLAKAAGDFIALGADPADAGAIRLSHAMGIYGESNTPGTDRAVVTWGVVANDVVGVGDAGTVTRVTGSALHAYAGATQVAQLGLATGDFLKMGDVVSTMGYLRVDDSFTLIQRNGNPGTADRNVIVCGGETVSFGDAAQTGNVLLRKAGCTVTLGSNYVECLGASQVILVAGGVSGLIVEGAQFRVNVASYRWETSVVSPKLYQNDDATNSATGDTMTVQAQNCTGTASIGGKLVVTGGTGTSTHGALALATNGGNIALWDATGSFGSGVGVLFGKTRTTAPSTAPVGGGLLYFDASGSPWSVDTGGIHVQLN